MNTIYTLTASLDSTFQKKELIIMLLERLNYTILSKCIVSRGAMLVLQDSVEFCKRQMPLAEELNTVMIQIQWIIRSIRSKKSLNESQDDLVVVWDIINKYRLHTVLNDLQKFIELNPKKIHRT